MAAILLAGFLVLLMPFGFGLIATGSSRAKNASHTMLMHLLVWAVAVIGFFMFGFALMGDGPVRTISTHWTFHHSRGYFLQADRNDPAALAWFILVGGYAIVCAAIPTGALIERWNLKSFVIFTFIIGAIIFPLMGCWLGNGGWLVQFGTRLGWGHGAIDYAGSGSVHLLGGSLAFISTWFIRPRIGKYTDSGRPRPILGHNGPMVMAGTLILLFCWFGFTTGRSFATGDGRAAIIAVNTLLAGAGGLISATAYMWFMYGRPDPTLSCNGLLAGLVAICAGCAFVSPWAALLSGIIGGVIAVWGVLACERRGLDDPVGATSVHGLAGIWGLLAVGLLADGTFGDALNGVSRPVRGLLYGGGGTQLLCQLIAVAACVLWGLLSGFTVLMALERLLGTNRVAPEVEMAGLDIPETGAPGYPEFVSHVAPDSTMYR